MLSFYQYFEEFAGNTSVNTLYMYTKLSCDVEAGSDLFCLTPCTKIDKPLLLHKTPCRTLIQPCFNRQNPMYQSGNSRVVDARLCTLNIRVLDRHKN